jgi:UvrD-like helicase family protein
MPKVALSDVFLESLNRLSDVPQKKVREFIRKFEADSTSNAINYERLQGHRNHHVRTVRIDQKYRAVVLHPDKGDVCVMMWVDDHEKAMDWAKRRAFEVNPRTGALQVYCVEEVGRAAPAVTKAANEPGLLESVDDDDLLALGIPEILLPAVRAITASSGLLALGRHLPSEAAEALAWLADGETAESVREAMSGRPKDEVDTTDLASALRHPDSRRRFVTIQTDEELTSILDAPLEKWRIFLHPSQEKLVVKTFNGPARVTGGAGTGKTVVAIHRARHLAKTVCLSPGDKVLFTTFTANLAQNVAQNLAQLCGPERDRIEVVHLHAWAARFLRDQGRKFVVASPSELDSCWEGGEGRARRQRPDRDPTVTIAGGQQGAIGRDGQGAGPILELKSQGTGAAVPHEDLAGPIRPGDRQDRQGGIGSEGHLRDEPGCQEFRLSFLGDFEPAEELPPSQVPELQGSPGRKPVEHELHRGPIGTEGDRADTLLFERLGLIRRALPERRPSPHAADQESLPLARSSRPIQLHGIPT